MEFKLPPPPPPLTNQLSTLSISPDSFPSSNSIDSILTNSNQQQNSTTTIPTLKQDEKEKEIEIRYTQYKGEIEIPIIMNLVDTELSEPYNFYTYRYFLMDWLVFFSFFFLFFSFSFFDMMKLMF